MVAGDVVAMMVFHVDDIKIAATEKVTEVVVSALNQRFPTKHLGEVEWYMGSEYKRDREKDTRVSECHVGFRLNVQEG